jgi:hypothetical protein
VAVGLADEAELTDPVLAHPLMPKPESIQGRDAMTEPDDDKTKSWLPPYTDDVIKFANEVVEEKLTQEDAALKLVELHEGLTLDRARLQIGGWVNIKTRSVSTPKSALPRIFGSEEGPLFVDKYPRWGEEVDYLPPPSVLDGEDRFTLREFIKKHPPIPPVADGVSE